MKIGIIGPAWPLRGGLADFDERFARELQSLGTEVTIYSYSLQYPAALFPGKTQLTDTPQPKDLRILSLVNSINPLNWRNAGHRIRHEMPDILIVRYWMPFFGPALGTILRIVAKNKHTRILCIADNILPHEKRPGDRAFTNYFIKPVHGFVTMSEEVMTDLKKLTDKPALRLHHPLYDNYGEGLSRSEALAQLQLPSEHKYALFFGFIRKYKGLDLLLEALADKRLAVAGIHLIIAGEYYGDKDFYENIIAKHNLENRVHRFTDFIPNDEVKLYFSAADCVVLPYRSATQSGITQVAYHFQRGMVATNVGGLPESVEDGVTGVICKPAPESIAEALLAFFTPGGLPHVEANLAARREQYSWRNFSTALIDFAARLGNNG
jgi:glycosyltransferase involved in cell wall biosynthesis